MDRESEQILEKLNEIEAENSLMRDWQSSINKLCHQMLETIEQLKSEIEIKNQQIDYLSKYGLLNRYRIDSLPYEMQDPDYISFFFKPHILSKEETRILVIDEHKSIARFGDGEFAAISGGHRWNFQDESLLLKEKLLNVLNSEHTELLIGLNPTFYSNLLDVDEIVADGVRAYMTPSTRRFHAEILDPQKIYADALFNSLDTVDDVERLKMLWGGKDCVIIEGKHTLNGIGNDLFDNCKTLERIICPAENAIDRYEAIMNEAIKQPKEKLVLISLGPTATALAYDLSLEGYQAVDIGHIDMNYEKYIRGTKDVFIPYKYCTVDEITRRQIETSNDPLYASQIIAVIE